MKQGMATGINSAISSIVEMRNETEFEYLIYKLTYLIATHDLLDEEERRELCIFLSNLKFEFDNLDNEVQMLKENQETE